VASLYLAEKSKDPGQILGTDQPWQLVLRFVHDVDASDMHDAFDEGLEKAAGEKLMALKPRIETLKAGMADFMKGQYLSFTNDPAKGVAVDVNGAGGPEIHGADFSAALLSIWIGAEPPNEDLKTGLLGGQCESPRSCPLVPSGTICTDRPAAQGPLVAQSGHTLSLSQPPPFESAYYHRAICSFH
jgi:hypothetical protein